MKNGLYIRFAIICDKSWNVSPANTKEPLCIYMFKHNYVREGKNIKYIYCRDKKRTLLMAL